MLYLCPQLPTVCFPSGSKWTIKQGNTPMDSTSPMQGDQSVTLLDCMGYVSTLARATPARDGTSIGTNIQKSVTST